MTKEKYPLGRIEICGFTREQDGPMEFGLLLNEGDLGILDQKGEITHEVWNWWRSSSFAVDIGLIFDRLIAYEMVLEASESEEVTT